MPKLKLEYTDNSKFNQLSEPEKLLALATAYLDAGLVFCKHIENDEKNLTWPNACTDMWLVAHSVELFLKGAILLQNQSLEKTHDLYALKEQYNKLYPDECFKWKLPFSIAYLDSYHDDDKFQNFIKKLPPPSIRYRYSDYGAERFDPKKYRGTLEDIKNFYESVFPKLIPKYDVPLNLQRSKWSNK